jgi:tetratricopeptide (TPR) repeat protein
MAFDKRKSLQNALAYTQQGKWDRAIVEYQSILKADPRDLTVCNNLGDLYARAGKTAEAIDQYLKLGELYRSDGLSVKAIAVYKKIAKLDPAHTQAYLACADLYWEQGLVGEAKIQMATVVDHYTRSGETPKLIEAYRRLTQFDPTNAAIIAKLADLMLKENMREAAAAEYERAAQAAQAAGHSADAKRLAQKARDLLPDAPQATVERAEALLDAGKRPEALDLLTAITAADARNARAWRLLGEVRASQGNAAEAIEALRQAVALGVPEPEVAGTLGVALLQTGGVTDAIALCQRATGERLAQGEADAALACCRELLQAAPHVTALHAHLSATLQRLGRDDEARAALRALGAAQETAGETEAAIATYRRVMELDPADVPARVRLELLAPSAPPVAEPAPALPPDVPEVPALDETPVVELSEDAPDLSLASLEELGLSLGPEEVDAASAEPVVELSDESSEASASTLSDLDLSFGREDMALLVEEADQATTTPDVPLVLDEREPTLEGPQDGSPAAGWLAQGYSSLESKEADVAVVASGNDTPPPPTPFELPDLSASIAEPETHTTPALEADESPLPVSAESGSVGDPPIEAVAPVEPSPGIEGSPHVPVVIEASPIIEIPVEEFPVVEIPDAVEPSSESLLDLDPSASEVAAFAPAEDAEPSSQVAEQLAEADVYQKYGLEEKARERLLEVVRLAPDNLTARRRLAAIYRDRRQRDEACGEILALARLLRKRGQEEAALAEAREGLLLMPGQPDLQQFVAERVEGNAPAVETVVAAERPVTVIVEGQTPEAASGADAAVDSPLSEASPELWGVVGSTDVVGEREETPAPPAAPPSLFEADEAAASAEPRVDLDRILGPVEGDDLPSELRALLDDIEPDPIVVLADTEGDDDQAMADDVAEAEFYLSQGMLDEAQAVHRRMQARRPDHPAVSALLDQIERTAEASASMTEPPAPAAPSDPAPPAATEEVLLASEPTLAMELDSALARVAPAFTVMDVPPEEAPAGFVNLGAELNEEFLADEAGIPLPGGGPLVDGLFAEGQETAGEHLDEQDYETHYNLGIAYKEMELYDEAIQEFRLIAQEPKRALECADLVGLCFLAKGQPEQAIRDLEAGLAIEGHAPEAYHSLRYDLGAALEAVGDLPRALEQLERLDAESGHFRDVTARVQALRARIQPTQAPATPRPAARKKKISFI